MLMLLFRLGKDRYAIATAAITEVIPKVELKKIPGSPLAVAGVLNYQNRVVPVIDLNQLINGTASCPLLSTRIILVNQAQAGEPERLLGLLAEQVIETLRKSQMDAIAQSVDFTQSPYLGEMLLSQQEMIQCLQIYQLMSEQEYAALMAEVSKVSSETPVRTTVG